MKTLTHKELLVKSLGTLFYSWGMDTPDEVYWAANELLDWFEKEFNVNLEIRFERDENTYEDNFDKVIEKIKNL